MSQHSRLRVTRWSVRSDSRCRLPILIPFAVLAVIAGVTIGMSKVLLAIPAEAATPIALAVSVNIMVAAAILAHRKRVGGATMIEMGAIVLYPIVIGIVIALLNIGTGEATEEHAPQGHNQGGGAVTAGGSVAAEALAFSTDSIELTAGEEAEITLDNADSAPHNIFVYPTEGDADALADDAALFTGDDVAPGDQATYAIPALDKGEFPFLCRIHPSMRGVITVK